ncbi:hypothetical protein [Microbacterium xanthum]|uniref:hypothetical protein n=1 Tax=Microbacterium xanthum TaxID=3079794 RepID=UPI002AD38DC7|nr:hypothetical protein [Microbacterium sp. KSW-48]MDZ8173086.1 hypothetical protein [Microbacterium sp. KSW-48]
MTTRAVDDLRAIAGTPLVLTLAGVAELAGVQRPVPSMWRTRFARSDDPFPAPVGTRRGSDTFDATEVAEWLARTGHGNNDEVRADAAAAATPEGFSYEDAQAVAEIEGLIALQAATGDLADLSVEDLRSAAQGADHDDQYLRAEVEEHADRGAPWVGWIDRLVDAAYSPGGALAVVAARRAAVGGAAGSAGRLHDDAVTLIAEAVKALTEGGSAAVELDRHDAALSAGICRAVGDDGSVTLPHGPESRRARRRLTVEGRWVEEPAVVRDSPRVVVARVPGARGDDEVRMLGALDEVALGLGDDDTAVVLGPARALVDTLDPANERLRADVLRTGRVRGIVRLAPGLVESAPREALAVWVFGAPKGHVPISDRFTVIADLTAHRLTPATRTDLVSDVVASMGGARDVRGHAFRFARFARTASLLARGGSLVASASTGGSAGHRDIEALPALVDTAAEAIRAELDPIHVEPGRAAAPAPATVLELVEQGHVRVVPGTRLDRELIGDEGLVVVAADDLDDPSSIGSARVDQFAFAAAHPTAALTRPGDVVFRTSPVAAAWVDRDGSKVVAYPARVLRVTPEDPGGLVPEIIAADIAGQAHGPAAWKQWMLRRVPPHTVAAVRAALTDVAEARAGLAARMARIDRYASVLIAGATSGAVTIIDSTPTAHAVSEQ